MKRNCFSITIALTAMLLCTAGLSNAQNAFKQGDEYSKTTHINANGVLQRGSQKFDISTASSVSKTYKVTGVTNNGFILTVTTTRITETLNAFDKKMAYDSNKPADTTSYIQMALQTLVGKVVTLSINKNGIITDANDPDERYATDTLMAFTGFNQDKFIIGTRLNLIADYQAGKKQGDTWASNTSLNDEKVSTTYTVGESDTQAKHTNLLITSTSTGADQNSNTNGVLSVDSTSGVIMIGSLKTATLSYKFINNAAYAFSRLTEVLESCTKLN